MVARYDDFSLVEAAGEDDQLLRGAGAGRRDDMREVALAGGQVDPAARPSLAAKDGPERSEALVLVQFVGPVKDEWLAKLRATGATVLGYAAQNGYIVHAAGDALARVTELVGSYPAVRAAMALRPGDKVERGASSGRVAVQTVAGAPGQDARAAAGDAGSELAPELSAARVRTQFLELSAAEVADLAADPAVVAIEPAGVPELHDERTAQIVAGNLTGNAPSGPGYEAWLATKGFGAPFGFAIDVTDSGLDRGDTVNVHPDLLGRVEYARNYTTDPDAKDCGGHGTNVTSIAAGLATAAGQDAQGFKHGLGVAPYADIGASKIFRCNGGASPANYPTLTSAAYNDGARISNNSWGISNFGGYNAASQAYDALVRDAQSGVAGNQEMVEVFSAGNDGDGKGNPADPKGDEGYGSITSPGTAKNVITVGAAESVRASGTDGCGVTNAGADSATDIINFSSRGPTQDGRLKPDIVAPGTHVVGASPQHGGTYTGISVCDKQFAGNVFYSLVSGTSQAAPQVAGRGRPAARLVGARGRAAAALARDDEGHAREQRGGHRGRQQRQVEPDPGRAEHGRGLGPRERRRRARRHAARVPRPADGPRLDRPERPALLRGRRHRQAGPRDARLDRPAAGGRQRQRLRERPRPRGERGRADLPRQLARRWRLAAGRPGRLPQQPRERGAARGDRRAGCP